MKPTPKTESLDPWLQRKVSNQFTQSQLEQGRRRHSWAELCIWHWLGGRVGASCVAIQAFCSVAVSMCCHICRQAKTKTTSLVIWDRHHKPKDESKVPCVCRVWQVSGVFGDADVFMLWHDIAIRFAWILQTVKAKAHRESCDILRLRQVSTLPKKVYTEVFAEQESHPYKPEGAVQCGTAWSRDVGCPLKAR